MKRILCIFLVFAILSAIGSVLSSCFPIVEEPEEKTAVYEEWNALLAAGFSTVALRTEWHDGRDVLQGEYDLTRTADGEYTVSFRSERFSVFDTESEAIPEDYITAATGSATIRAGQIAVQSGDAPDLPVGKLLLSDLHFSEKSLQETRADGARLTARGDLSCLPVDLLHRRRRRSYLYVSVFLTNPSPSDPSKNMPSKAVFGDL